jgi:hypothetical protein
LTLGQFLLAFSKKMIVICLVAFQKLSAQHIFSKILLQDPMCISCTQPSIVSPGRLFYSGRPEGLILFSGVKINWWDGLNKKAGFPQRQRRKTSFTQNLPGLIPAVITNKEKSHSSMVIGHSDNHQQRKKVIRQWSLVIWIITTSPGKFICQ